MNKKTITIKNTYHKKLSFSVFDKPFSLDAGEVKTVDADVGGELLKNGWITIVHSLKTSVNAEIAHCSSCQQRAIIQEAKIENDKEEDRKEKLEIKIKENKGRIGKKKTR